MLNIHNHLCDFLDKYPRLGRVVMAVALVSQLLTLYVIATLLYENRSELYDAFKDTLYYIFTGKR